MHSKLHKQIFGKQNLSKHFGQNVFKNSGAGEISRLNRNFTILCTGFRTGEKKGKCFVFGLQVFHLQKKYIFVIISQDKTLLFSLDLQENREKKQEIYKAKYIYTKAFVNIYKIYKFSCPKSVSTTPLLY